MTESVSILNESFDPALTAIASYYKKQNEDNTNLAIQTGIMTALSVAQMVVYWQLFDDVIEKRDTVIDDQMRFLDELQGYKANDDVMLNAKKSALGMPLPDVNNCNQASQYNTHSAKDGKVVDKVSEDAARCACVGMPTGWLIYDGQLEGALASGVASSFMVANAKRRRENQQHKKVSVVRAAQQGMKSVYNAQDILGYYQQSTSIYQGLSDIFISGFNSAGAAMGTAIGRMASQNSGASKNSEGGQDFSNAESRQWDRGR